MNNLNIDYALLATQKLALLNDSFCQTDAGQGILCLIDALQDEDYEKWVTDKEEQPNIIPFNKLKEKGYSWDGSGIGNNNPHAYLWQYAAGMYYPIIKSF